MKKAIVLLISSLLLISCGYSKYYKLSPRYQNKLAPVCQECGTKTVYILYGMPTEKGMRMARKKEVILGGCTIHPAYWACPNCHAEYYKNGERSNFKLYKPSPQIDTLSQK